LPEGSSITTIAVPSRCREILQSIPPDSSTRVRIIVSGSDLSGDDSFRAASVALRSISHTPGMSDDVEREEDEDGEEDSDPQPVRKKTASVNHETANSRRCISNPP